MKLFSTRTLFVFLGMLFVASALQAQFETAEVLGTVHDPSGNAVPNASVTLLNQGTSIESKTTSNGSGDYDFANVKVGRYTVSVEAAGFSKVSAADIDVAGDKILCRRYGQGPRFSWFTAFPRRA